MNRTHLLSRVRNHTRDFSSSIYREQDIFEYFDESIDRIKQVIPELSGMKYLANKEDEPILLPSHYHNLIAIYAVSRAFGQDERHYQATNYMNEFETKLDELKTNIETGLVVITNPDGTVVAKPQNLEYVTVDYFKTSSEHVDLDDGVEGV